MHSVLATVPLPTGVLGHGVGQLLGQFGVPSAVSDCMDRRHTACACYIEHLPVNGYATSNCLQVKDRPSGLVIQARLTRAWGLLVDR